MPKPPKEIAFHTQCWNCGDVHDASTPATTDEVIKPKNGDVTICFDCGAFGVFDDAFEENIRKPTPDENFELKRNKEIQLIYQAWYLYKTERKNGHD